MTEAEARRLAAEEGLVLVPAHKRTGWKGVFRSGARYKAQLKQGGKLHSLGVYASAAEAALAVARFLGPAGCAAAAPAPPPAAAPPAATQPAVTEAEARQLAAAEGLQLVILDAVPVSGVKRARVW